MKVYKSKAHHRTAGRLGVRLWGTMTYYPLSEVQITPQKLISANIFKGRITLSNGEVVEDNVIE